jgi:hypothetical protein
MRQSSNARVKHALELAEEADLLERRGDKKQGLLLFALFFYKKTSLAVLKLADACSILYEQALVNQKLREPLENLIVRAERLKGEIVLDNRVATRTLYDTAPLGSDSSSALMSPKSPSVMSAMNDEPKGKGKFVSEGHSSFPLVNCIMMSERKQRKHVFLCVCGFLKFAFLS